MKKISLVMLALVAFTNNAHAWKETGGGDDIGLEFREAFAGALRTIKEGKIRGKFSVEDLERATENASVVVVDTPLTVRFGDLEQDSVAINVPEKLLIKVNRARWSYLKSVKLREAIALHEVLSLIGVERTGNYEISARYLELAGLSPWLVSGFDEGKVERPTPKSLSCVIGYLPIGVGYDKEERLTYTAKLKEAGVRQPYELAARQTLTTKDGRFTIEVWGIQPFRTAFNPTAYEHLGISLRDNAKETFVSAGPFPDHPLQNEKFVRLAYMNGSVISDFVSVTAKCSLN